MLVQQVAMDQNAFYPDDISNVSEFTVHNLIPKFSADEEEYKRKAHIGNNNKSNTHMNLFLICIYRWLR